MPADRIFLDWDRPCLHKATDYLQRRYCTSGAWDMGGVLVVTQSARAGRRLIELLAERTMEVAGDSALVMTPPRVVTVGHFPEELYDPQAPVASPLETLLARLAVLRTSPDMLADLVPYPPPYEDFMAWYRIADDLGALLDDLEAEDVTLDRVSEISATQFGVDDHKRWDAITRLYDAFGARLTEAGLQSARDARHVALSEEIPFDLDIVLLATVDLPGITRRFIKAVEANVTALVWAPDDLAESFDNLGCVIPDRWQTTLIPLAGGIDIVNRPIDQANRVVKRALSIGARPEEVLSVALGDEDLGPTVERLLELAGIKARRSAGRDASTTGPALLLKSIGEYASNRSPQTLAALLRQPDIVDRFDEAQGRSGCWIASLDRIAAAYLPSKLDCDWAGLAAASDVAAMDTSLSPREQWSAREKAEDARALMSAIAACDELLEGLGCGMTTLRNWSPRIAQMLAHVYRNRQFDTGDPAQSATVRALQALGDCLERQQEIAADDALVVPVSAGDAILFTVKQLSSMPIPAAAEDMAVEIAGWLEAPLDDAPVLVIAGMNEGFLPRSVSADAFLPNRMRAALGLVDNSARYARDSYLLCAAAHSRGENLHVVCGRVTADGDPLRPSRLLFACEEDAMVRRALRFYEDKNDPSPSMPLLHYGTDYDLATISLPRTLAKPIARISVTAFATYLACPYRFYLQRLVGLDAPNEQCDEMDGAMFGSLAHEVFRRFGGAPIKYSTDRDEIERFLGDALVDASRDQFGTDLLPAVEIQLRQLKMRLDCFAQLQARIAGEGWKILYAEHDLGLDVPIDGVPTAIVGKVDRIDYNRDLDRYRLIDYKTGDAGDSPEATHRKTKDGLKTWVGLQLPLYQRMAAQALKIDASKIEVGYILLPKHVDKAGYKAAEWTADEFQSAYDVAVSVLHDIRHEKFWPPSESVPAYPDGLETICMDLCPDRPAIVRNSTGVMAEWKRGRA